MFSALCGFTTDIPIFHELQEWFVTYWAGFLGVRLFVRLGMLLGVLLGVLAATVGIS